MRDALDKAGLSDIRVTVPFHYGIMAKAYPPSAGEFKQKYRGIIKVPQPSTPRPPPTRQDLTSKRSSLKALSSMPDP